MRTISLLLKAKDQSGDYADEAVESLETGLELNKNLTHRYSAFLDEARKLAALK